MLAGNAEERKRQKEICFEEAGFSKTSFFFASCETKEDRARNQDYGSLQLSERRLLLALALSPFFLTFPLPLSTFFVPFSFPFLVLRKDEVLLRRQLLAQEEPQGRELPKDACPARRGRATRGASPPADDGCEGDDGRRRSIDEDFAPLDLPRGLCSPSLCSPRRRHGSKQHSERLFTTRSRSARVLLRGWEHRLLSMKKRSSAAAQRAGQPATPQARRAALSLSLGLLSRLSLCFLERDGS